MQTKGGTPAQHRAAAHLKWAKTTDRSAATKPARDAFNARFEKEARRIHPDASEATIALVAESLRRAHFSRLAAASVKVRYG